MKVRIKFTKEAPVKYLGHLDILRFFQKCFVRARVKMLYSEGFNPHQKLSFALPLGVGITSRAEFLDADIEDGQNLKEVKERLNSVSGDGFRILDIREVKEGAESLMSAVAFASYEVSSLKGGFFIPEGFMEQEKIPVAKKTKKGSREVDIKPLIFKLEGNDPISMFLSAGSLNNLKPELLLEAVCSFSGTEYARENFELVRTGLYGPDKTDLIEHETVL